MTIFKRAAIGITAAALAVVPLTACSSSSSGTSSTTGTKADSTAPVATVSDLSKGVMTQVTLDSGFVQALTTLKLTPAPVGTAKIDSGVASFPITGGHVTYYKPGTVNPFVQGTIQHNGSGLSLTGGSTKVELTNFTIDPGASKLYGDVSVNGTKAATQAYLFYLDGTTLKALQTSGDDAILEGTKVEVSPDAATVLNKVFNTTAVQPNLLVGIAKITVATK